MCDDVGQRSGQRAQRRGSDRRARDHPVVEAVQVEDRAIRQAPRGEAHGRRLVDRERVVAAGHLHAARKLLGEAAQHRRVLVAADADDAQVQPGLLRVEPACQRADHRRHVWRERPELRTRQRRRQQPQVQPADARREPQARGRDGGQRGARAEVRRHRRERQRAERHELAEHAVFEMVAADAQHVVAGVEQRRRDRGDRRQALPQERRQGAARAYRRDQRPDDGDDRPQPRAVFERERCEVAHAGLGPRLGHLREVGVRQPFAVERVAPRDVRGDRQQRGEPARGRGEPVAADLQHEAQTRRRDQQQAVGPRQRRDRRRDRPQREPARARCSAGAHADHGPADERQVEQRRLEAARQPRQERAAGDDRGDHQQRDRRRQPGAPAIAHGDRGRGDDRELADAARQRQHWRGVGWFDAEPAPRRPQQQRPQESRVAFDRGERRVVPDQAAAGVRVGDVAERDVGVVAQEPHPPGAEQQRGEQHQQADRERQAAARGGGGERVGHANDHARRAPSAPVRPKVA